MVQLLLALSKADNLVLPSKVDYMQSDCMKIDRDKSQKEFYTSFGTTSFENPALS